MSDRQHLIHKAVGSLKWSAMIEIVTRTAQPLITIILANLLVPEDFGIVGTALIVISFCRMFLDAGLGKALVQTNLPAAQAANSVFWINITIGFLVYAIIFLSAPALSAFFNSPASEPVIQILGLQVIILSFTAVQEFLFVRNMGFRDLFWAKLAMALTPGLFSIPMAGFGMGVWALVAGTLVGSVMNMLILWYKSSWRPSFAFDPVIARQLFRFGIWIVLEGFGIWLIGWGDQLLVGRYLSVRSLGVYQLGWAISYVLFGLIMSPLLRVLYSAFSRLQDQGQQLESVFHKVTQIITALVIPTAIGLLMTAPEIVRPVFGDKWQGLGFVLSSFAVLHGTGALVAANAELYRSVGRPDINTKLLVIQLVYYLPVYLVSIQFGLKTFVVARTLLAVISLPLHVFFIVRILGYSPFYLWRDGKRAAEAGLLMMGFLCCLKIAIFLLGLPSSDWIKMPLLVIPGAAVYLGALWLLDSVFCRNTIALLRKAMGGVQDSLSSVETTE